MRILKYLAYIVFLPFWWLQKLIPRSNKIWVFGAWYGQRFSDNSRYLFEYLNKEQEEIEAIWITREKKVKQKIINNGGKAFLNNEIKGIYYCLIASNIFVSSGKKDINYLWINGARWIQLWHGSPLKKIGLDDKFSKANSFFQTKIVSLFFSFVYEYNYHFIISNATVFTNKMSTSFNLAVSKVLETGCPRNDAFYSNQQDSFNKELRDKYVGCKLVYYLPTFRGYEGAKTLFNNQDFNNNKLEMFLEQHNIVFVSKGHFVDNTLGENTNKTNRLIHLQDENVDEINFMLKDADLLITDYSSAYFDFLLTERPVIFAAFDLKEYTSGSRELYFKYEEVIAGTIVENWDSLFKKLETVWEDKKLKDLIVAKNKIFNKHHDAKNSQRVYEYFYNIS